MLNLLGRRADGWIAPLATAFETKPAAQDRIDRAANAAGREPRDIRRVIQLVGAVTHRQETHQRPRRGPSNEPLHTTADIWAEVIAELVVAERFDAVNLIPQHETRNRSPRSAIRSSPSPATPLRRGAPKPVYNLAVTILANVRAAEDVKRRRARKADAREGVAPQRRFPIGK